MNKKNILPNNGATADFAFGLMFSLVCSSVVGCILVLSPAQSAEKLSRQPLGRRPAW